MSSHIGTPRAPNLVSGVLRTLRKGSELALLCGGPGPPLGGAML